MTDLGPDLIEWFHATLLIDEEWEVRDERSLTWWPHRLRQQVVADVPRESHGEEVTRLTATTPIWTGVSDAAGGARLAAIGNLMASLSALVYDEGTDTISARCAASFWPGNRRWLAPLFASAAALQIAVAEAGDPETAAGPSGLALDDRAHPRSGPRSDRDDMLNVIGLYQQHGARPVPATPTDYRVAGTTLAPTGAEVTPRGEKLSIRVALGRLQGAAEIAIENSEHPGFGTGILALAAAPKLPRATDLFRVANDLNRREIDERIDGHAFGAWVPRDDRLYHVAFYPNLLLENDEPKGRQARLANLGLDEITRARWLDGAWDAKGPVAN